ncbi:MAG: thioredoxin [Candidatus Woesearchaeota archaeon]
MVENITTENFEEKTKTGLVVVDFYADWCGPCKMMAPTLDKIDREQTEMTIYKVNVEEQQDLAVKFGVRGIPTFVVFKDGKQLESFSGFMPEPEFLAKIKEVAQ